MVTTVAMSPGRTCSTNSSTPVSPMAIGTPAPSTTACTAIRSVARNHLVRRVDRRPRRAVGQRRHPRRWWRRPRRGTTVLRLPSRTPTRPSRPSRRRRPQDSRASPKPQTEAAQEWSGEHGEEHDVDEIEQRGVPGQEPSQVGRVGIAVRGPFEEHEIHQLGSDRRQDLVADDRNDQWTCEQRAQWRTRATRPGLSRWIVGLLA